MAEASTDPQGRSVSDLEREVETERMNVSKTIDALQSKASMSNIFEEVVKVVGENGGVASRNLGRALRDNPLPALLAGVGLAWLMAGGGGPRLHRPHRLEWDEDDINDDDDGYYYRDTAVPTPPQPYDVSSGGGTTYAGGEFTEARTASGYGGDARTDTQSSSQSSAHPGVLERASSAAGQVRDRAGSVAEGVRRRAADASGAVRRSAEDAGSALYDAGEAAQARARAARRSAMQAGRRGREGLEEMMHEQPLIFGALALAIGAAVGGALPRSETEDRMFGDRSDRLKEGARRVAETEGAKAQAVASAVAREAVNMADEAAGDASSRTPSGAEAVDKAEAGVRSAAERLAEAGRAEAERQHLGEEIGRDVNKTES
jgi:hypothetical protein